MCSREAQLSQSYITNKIGLSINLVDNTAGSSGFVCSAFSGKKSFRAFDANVSFNDVKA